MTALSTLSTTMGKTRTYKDTRCPYLRIIIDETFIKYITGKYSPLCSTKPDVYIYIYNPMHIYVSMCKVHANSKHASINRELI